MVRNNKNDELADYQKLELFYYVHIVDIIYSIIFKNSALAWHVQRDILQLVSRADVLP